MFETNRIIEYNHKRKIISGLFYIFFFAAATSLLLLYIFYFRQLAIFEGTFIERLINFFKNEITNTTFLGLFIVAIIGGLFFIPLPMEGVFVLFLVKNPNTLAVFFVYLAGISLGYMIDLFVGYRFSIIGKKMISTKKFYEIKTMINHYGKWAILIASATPLPGQIVAFIAGVFKYNKTKFFVQFLLGITIKLVVITLFIKGPSLLF